MFHFPVAAKLNRPKVCWKTNNRTEIEVQVFPLALGRVSHSNVTQGERILVGHLPYCNCGVTKPAKHAANEVKKLILSKINQEDTSPSVRSVRYPTLRTFVDIFLTMY